MKNVLEDLRTKIEGKTVYLFLSSGIDSAILLELLLRNSIVDPAKLQLYTRRRDPFCEPLAQKIRLYFEEKFQTTLHHEVVDDSEDHHSLRNWTLLENLIEDPSIEVALSADTKNPPQLSQDPGAPERPEGAWRFEPEGLLRPFVEITKADVFRLVSPETLQDLIPITRSCVSMTEENCGHCWWCRERKWALAEQK